MDDGIGDGEDEAQDKWSMHENVVDFDKQYPNRPKNEHPTPAFHILVDSLWQPLLLNSRKGRFKRDPRHGGLKPHQVRRKVIDNFLQKWRAEVGNDIHPAMRLTLPDKDRDRNMYGVKEKALAKYIIKFTGMQKDAEDAIALMNWKAPGQSASSAGDFPSRCYGETRQLDAHFRSALQTPIPPGSR